MDNQATPDVPESSSTNTSTNNEPIHNVAESNSGEGAAAQLEDQTVGGNDQTQQNQSWDPRLVESGRRMVSIHLNVLQAIRRFIQPTIDRNYPARFTIIAGQIERIVEDAEDPHTPLSPLLPQALRSLIEDFHVRAQGHFSSEAEYWAQQTDDLEAMIRSGSNEHDDNMHCHSLIGNAARRGSDLTRVIQDRQTAYLMIVQSLLRLSQQQQEFLNIRQIVRDGVATQSVQAIVPLTLPALAPIVRTYNPAIRQHNNSRNNLSRHRNHPYDNRRNGSYANRGARNGHQPNGNIQNDHHLNGNTQSGHHPNGNTQNGQHQDNNARNGHNQSFDPSNWEARNERH